jgi:hypothetical protein
MNQISARSSTQESENETIGGSDTAENANGRSSAMSGSTNFIRRAAAPACTIN